MTDLPKIAQSRLRQQASVPLGAHPDANVLTAFVEGGLKDAERGPLLAHLASCAECREIVSLSLPEKDAAALSAATTRTGLLGSWNPAVLRWGAVAASVVVIASAVLLLNPHPRQYITSNPVPSSSTAEPKATAAQSSTPPIPANQGTARAKAFKQEGRQELDKFAKAETPSASKKSADSAFVRSPVVQPSPPPSAAQQSQQLQDSAAATPPALVAENVPSAPSGAVNRDTEFAANRRMNAADGALNPKPPSAQATAASGPGTAAKAPANAGAAVGRMVGGGIGSGSSTGCVGPGRADNDSNVATSACAEQKSSGTPAQNVQLARNASPPPAKPDAKEKDTKSADQVTSANETVEVTAQAPALNTTSASLRARFVNVTTSWHIANGKLLTRSELGTPWQEVPFADNPKLRTLAIQANNIWVGGAKGVLYHSPDAGKTWSLIKGGWSVQSDIVALTFRDSQQGQLTTSDREQWVTSDGGNTWRKQ